MFNPALSLTSVLLLMIPVSFFKHVSSRDIGRVSRSDVMWCFLGRGTMMIFFQEEGMVPVTRHVLRSAGWAFRPEPSRSRMRPILSFDRPAAVLSLLPCMYSRSSSSVISSAISWKMVLGCGKASASHA